MKTVGERIRHIRTEQGLTLEELAKKAQISKSFLWAVENDKSDISGGNVVSIANALGASADYILRGEGKEEESAPIEIPRELSEMAAQHELSFRETYALLQAQVSIVARRSKNPDTVMTIAQWERLWEGIKEFIKDKKK